MPEILVQHVLPIVPEDEKKEYSRPTRLFRFSFDIPAFSGNEFTISLESIKFRETGSLNDVHVSGGASANEPDELKIKLNELSDLPARTAFLDTPIDFVHDRECRMIFFITSKFLTFSDGLEAITLKEDCGHRYRNVKKLHWTKGSSGFETAVDGECRIISIVADKPFDEAYKVRHGFSFNLNLKQGKSGIPLPLTIDPDIENKGKPG